MYTFSAFFYQIQNFLFAKTSTKKQQFSGVKSTISNLNFFTIYSKIPCRKALQLTIVNNGNLPKKSNAVLGQGNPFVKIQRRKLLLSNVTLTNL